MPIANLFSDQPEMYVEQERDADHLWLFLHIPKTAGSSFRIELARMLRPNANIHIDYTNRDVEPRDQMRLRVERFKDEALQTKFRFASGHINMDQALAIRARHPRTKFITMLRHPADRLLSDFRYARTPKHPPFQDFITRFPTIESYVESEESQNKMSRFLSPAGAGTTQDTVKFLDENLAFLGVLARYALSFRVLTSLLGSSRAPEIHQRKTEDLESNQVEITPKLRKMIREANEKDFALYSYYLEKIDASRAALVQVARRSSAGSQSRPLHARR